MKHQGKQSYINENSKSLTTCKKANLTKSKCNFNKKKFHNKEFQKIKLKTLCKGKKNKSRKKSTYKTTKKFKL